MDFSNLPALLSSSPAYALPLLFLGGVLTSLTPCIYPMIPITAAIVGGAQTVAPGEAPRTRRQVVALTLAYVIGLALAYSSLGLIAGLTGTMFGTISTNPWLYFSMANVLIFSALALLDVIPVRLPQRLLSRAAMTGPEGAKSPAGRYTGALLMGGMSGLVAAPCSAPVMVGVLTWVATTKSAVLGFFYLFAFSLGMCTILVAVGLSSGLLTRLPRAGVWMLWVKRIFAAILLAVAEYYLVKMGQLII